MMFGELVEASAEDAAHWEKQQEQNRKYRADLLQKQNYLDFLSTFEHNEMVKAFIRIRKTILDDALYWQCLHWVYTNKEVRLSDRKTFWLECFSANRGKREEFMTAAEDRRAFEQLPDQLTIYRGYQNKRYRTGLSWTLLKKMAVWFAYRWSEGTPRVVSGSISKADVFGYTNERKEQEIIADPSKITDLADIEDIGPSPFV